jgi:alpha-beta hydrolase superfamily lysophospholipase
MLDLTDAALKQEDECLALIRAGGDGPAIFAVHGLHCDLTFALLLSRSVSRDFPIYGFRGLGVTGRSKPLSTIESIAARYIEPMRRVQHRGPYVLLGFCAGGHVAMEMAHQLSLAGDQVSHLFLIETTLTVDSAYIEQAVTLAEQRLTLGDVIRKHWAGGPATVAAFGEALQAYRPKPYPGRVHIITNQNWAALMLHPERGWQRYLSPDTPIHVAAPTHDVLVQQRISSIGTYIGQQFGLADEAAGSPDHS